MAREGIDIECVDASGATPLWLAAASGHSSCVAALLQAGASVSVMSGGKTALEAAQNNRHVACVELLEALPAERLALPHPLAHSASTSEAAELEAGGVEEEVTIFTGQNAGARLAAAGARDDSDEEGLLEGVAPEDH